MYHVILHVITPLLCIVAGCTTRMVVRPPSESEHSGGSIGLVTGVPDWQLWD
jgi:hypothetical protein